MTYMKVRSGTGGIEWESSGGGRGIDVFRCVIGSLIYNLNDKHLSLYI